MFDRSMENKQKHMEQVQKLFDLMNRGEISQTVAKTIKSGTITPDKVNVRKENEI